MPRSYPDNPKLGTWVGRQWIRGRLSVSQERASKLDSIGFIWGSKLDARWEIMFDELKDFKAREGHCNVPRSYPENPKLGKWVRSQREKKITMKLSRELQSKFDSIGFIWNSLDARWEIMFDELRKFNEREGQFNVCYTDQDNSELAR